METKLQFVTRTVVFLTLALTSLGAAPIYQAHYHGQATLTSRTVTCRMSLTRDDARELISHWETPECAQGAGLGAYIYGESPSFSLPAGSVVLFGSVNQWGHFNIEAFDGTYSVEPFDPGKPFSGETFRGPNVVMHVEAPDWPHESQLSEWVPYTYQLGFHLLGTDYRSWAREVSLRLFSGDPAPSNEEPLGPVPGMNSLTTQTFSYRLVDGTAFYDVYILYEAPIPEPATASLFLAGAAGLLLLRRILRTRLHSRR
jgi:hypothetical protein